MTKVGILQMDILWENGLGNVEKLLKLTEAAQGFDLLILPELWSCGFTMNQKAHETFDVGWQAMVDLSLRLDCAVLGGLPRVTEGGQENRCYLTEKGKTLGHYTKIKAFKFAGEHLKYQPGHKTKRFDVAGFQLSPFICYDLRFPELARSQVPQSNLMTYVACWPETRIAHWRALLVARAMENQCYVIGVNRVGKDGAGLTYSGDSLVVSPLGEILLDCGHEEGLFSAVIEPQVVAEVRDRFHFLDDINDNWG